MYYFFGLFSPSLCLPQDIGVQGYSTLHCIRGAVEIQPVSSKKPSLTQMESTLAHMNIESPQDEAEAPVTSGKAEHRFFVFCKKPCKAMTPGKLRVRCATCKGGSFVLERGPGGWDDVLTPRKLKGQCYTDTCRGTDAEFFFKCSRHPTTADEQCVALHMVRKNTVGVDCASCFEQRDTVVVFDCPDKHTLCLDCFMEYCEVQLQDRQFEEHRSAGYTLRCPAKCEGSEIKESHHFRIMGPEKYDRYQRFGTEEFVLQMGGVLCPARGCGMGLLPEDPTARRVQCPRESGGCGFVFCRHCKEEFHNGTCHRAHTEEHTAQPGFQVDPERLQRARWIEASERFVQSNTKQCPRCRVPVEKNGGCMHMTCSMGNCKFEWCWICGVAWNRNCQSSHWFG
jgi:parkin